MRAFLFVTLAACSSTAPINADDASAQDSQAAETSIDASDASSDVVDAAPQSDAQVDAGDALAKLLALTSTCNQVSNGLYALNAGDTPTVAICQATQNTTTVLFWKADMDVDCDGKQTTQCSLQTDPDFQNQTAATDSQNNPLDAANLPYVVVPGKSTRFDFGGAGLKLGDVIAVIYNNQIEYAVYGDVGPSADIGEASYATVNDLGANPNPKTGGVDAPDVLYVAFPGAIVTPIENHAQAVTVGQAKLAALVGP